MGGGWRNYVGCVFVEKNSHYLNILIINLLKYIHFGSLGCFYVEFLYYLCTNIVY